MNRFSVAATIIALTLSSVGNAAIIGTVTQNPDPAPGLVSFTIGATGTEGEIVNSFADINVLGPVHNVTAFASAPSITVGDWDDVSPFLGNPAWRIFDTHLLFDLTNNPSQIVGLLGNAPTETNDGSNPVGLALVQGGFPATVGVGSYGGQTNADQFALTPAAASSHVDFLQVVYVVGQVPTARLVAFDTTGRSQLLEIPVTAIPEPSTMALAGLSLIGLVLRRRNG